MLSTRTDHSFIQSQKRKKYRWHNCFTLASPTLTIRPARDLHTSVSWRNVSDFRMLKSCRFLTASIRARPESHTWNLRECLFESEGRRQRSEIGTFWLYNAARLISLEKVCSRTITKPRFLYPRRSWGLEQSIISINVLASAVSSGLKCNGAV